MTTDQIILFALFFIVFAMLIWGKLRYDLIAFGALVIALILGVVPREQAFSGFSHPATVIIALVLIISRALSNSGAIDLISHYVVDSARSLLGHIAIMSVVAAGLSAIMNNVAALALLMPIDLQAARKAERSPALTLMPISFASILGGLVTLIGTPPNIIIASFRQRALGEPFGMFDFAPVGAACAVAGIIFITLVGWRLIPRERTETNTGEDLFNLEGYVAEASVKKKSGFVGKKVSELDEIIADFDVQILGLVRRGERMAGLARRVEIKAGDVLVLEAGPEEIEKFASEFDLEYAGGDKYDGLLKGGNVEMVEALVPEGARIEGRSALSVRLLYRHSVALIGISRKGRRSSERVRAMDVKAGDILLLLGPSERLPEIVRWLGCLPLAERGLQVIQREKAGITVGIFAIAIGLAVSGLLYLPVALAAACVAMVTLRIVPPREVYESIEWPVIVLLGSLIPLGAALEQSGGTALIAQNLVVFTEGYGPVVVMTVLMVVTMTLSDVLNNTATTVIAAPIALDIASRLEVNPDAFLMAVAVAASCAFLTPIGHKNNTLILGPGGYRFGDYWRMGLPLEILIIAVAVPCIILFWPL